MRSICKLQALSREFTEDRYLISWEITVRNSLTYNSLAEQRKLSRRNYIFRTYIYVYYVRIIFYILAHTVVQKRALEIANIFKYEYKRLISYLIFHLRKIFKRSAELDFSLFPPIAIPDTEKIRIRKSLLVRKLQFLRISPDSPRMIQDDWILWKELCSWIHLPCECDARGERWRATSSTRCRGENS